MRFIPQRRYRWSTIGEEVDKRDHNEDIPLATHKVTSAEERRTTPATCQNGHALLTVHDRRSSRMPMWNPLWLRSVSLVAISAGFASLAVVSIILWHYSNVHNGFALISTNHYSWTYGPTAVLVLVVAVWRQVDYYCKALAPWRALQQGGAKAADSLLLDYVSPFLPIALFRAICERHWAISATISGFILLKLITIASTGLLTLVPTKITLPKSQLVGVTQLDGLLVNTSTFAPSPTLSDPSIVYNAYGVMAKGLPYAEGTKPNLVYESFALSQAGALQNVTMSAMVNAFIPHLTCEEVGVFINLEPKNSTDTYPQDKVNITSSSCILDPYLRPIIHVLNPLEELVPPRQLSGVMATVNCTNTPFSGEQLLVLADIRYNQTLADPSVTYAVDEIVNATDGTTEVKQVTSILCWPSYSVEEVTVTYDMAQSPPNITVSESNTRTNRTFPNLSYSSLSDLFTSSLAAVETTFGDIVSGAVALEYPDPMFKMMGQVNGGGYQALLNATAMSEAAQAVFQNTVVQIVHKNLLRHHTYPLTGTISYSEQRLEIRTVSFALMLSGFAAMIGLSTFVFFTRPMNTVPRDPEPIATTALVLTQSKEVQDLLLASSQISEQALCQKLSHHRFSTDLSNGAKGHRTFEIRATESLVPHDEPLPATKPSGPHWWKPLWARLPILISLFFLVLALVVVLEVLQRASDRENGITTIPATSGFTITVTTRWIPAVVMVLVATSFNAYDFTTSTFAPYHTLKKSSVPASRSLMSYLVGKLPPHALLVSLRHRHWGPFFSSTAALVGSLLTIIVSGLYTGNNVETFVPFHLQSADSFNPAWPNSVTNDGGAAVVASLTENLNLSYPPFTYGELAFPTLQSLTSASVYGGSNSETTMTVTIPALRASLDCEYLSPRQFNITAGYNPQIDEVSLGVQGTIPLPENCPFGGMGGNLSYMDLPLAAQSGNSSYFGLMTDLHVGPWPADYFSSIDELEIGAQKDNPPGCPSLAFAFGYYDLTDSFDAAQPKATAMFCYQRMQQVLTNVTLTLPGLSIAADQPPIPDESTVKLLSSGPNGETAFEYRIQVHMDNQFSLFTQSQYSANGSSLTAMDNFFRGVLFGKQPIPQTALVGAANRETVMNGIQGFYRRYMAQAISENMRVKHADSSQAQNFSGIAINHNNLRLFQNKASKLTLQVMLVFMLICGLLAFVLTGTKYILPHNPWTIAGKASLLAGSELCSESMRERTPPGALWMSDKELKENGVWQGWLFSLGWWDWKRGERRRWGIDVGQAESES
jgi:hypothetical protein